MPPTTEPRPAPDDVKAVTRWLVSEFERQDALAPPYVGRVAPRRLNRTEYNNTVRDLLGVDFRPADDFPPDDSGYGFDNNGDVLSMSPMLMEKYLKAAERVARTAVFGLEALKPSSYTHQPWYIDFDTTRAVKTEYDETGLSLPYALHVTQQIPVEGDYDLTAIMRGFRVVGADAGRLAFWVDGKLVHEGSVAGRADGEMNGQSDTFRAHLTAGEHWLAVSMLKMYEGLPKAYGGPNPNQSTARVSKSPSEHFISNLVVTGPFNQVLGPTAESLQKIYGVTPPKGKVDPALARQIVAKLARRAYRRPVSAREVDQLASLVALAQKNADSFQEGLSLAITRILVSPNFLFRLERDPPSGPARAVNAHELATRLSYFLWSSMPDDALLQSADKGTLTQPAVLAAEVRRMIADPKSSALVAAGADFALPSILEPLAPFRNQLTVFSGLANRQADALGDGGGDHARAGASFLTGAHPKKTGGSDIYAGVSADQVAAQQIGQSTRLPSLELGLDDNRTVGHCDSGYSCAYTNSISWRGPSTPLPPEVNPRLLFERLFGDFDASVSADVRARRAMYRKSILDSANAETRTLMGQVGPSDKRKLDEYLTSIREVEQRIQQAETAVRPADPRVEKPSGIPSDFGEHAKLIYDLQVLAFQADLTRVASMAIGREGSVRTYEQIGVADPHHPLSHHQNRAEALVKLAKINRYHVELFGHFLNRLRTTPDGDGTLLDHSMILYGCGISDSNRHLHDNLPVVVAGGGGGLQGNRHVRVTTNTLVTNLYLSLLDRMDVRTDKLGDSTGKLDL